MIKNTNAFFHKRDFFDIPKNAPNSSEKQHRKKNIVVRNDEKVARRNNATQHEVVVRGTASAKTVRPQVQVVEGEKTPQTLERRLRVSRGFLCVLVKPTGIPPVVHHRVVYDGKYSEFSLAIVLHRIRWSSRYPKGMWSVASKCEALVLIDLIIESA